jgi:putative IMPACT (imprinted ancient) family translation regulator
VTERVPRLLIALVVEYSAVTPLKRLLPEYEAEISGEEYGADVTYQIRLPAEHYTAFAGAVNALTNGQALLEIISRQA